MKTVMKTQAERPFSVIDQTFTALAGDISAGKFRPGERLPGDRELSRMYNVGRSSMIKVLGMLKEERYVERVPVYGTFVRDDIQQRRQEISLAFATSDASLSPSVLNHAHWGTMMEIIRGVFEESSVHPGVRVTLMYCPESSDPMVLRGQTEDLAAFDGVIFSGHLMHPLKENYLRLNKPGVVLAPKLTLIQESLPAVDIDSTHAIEDMARIVAGEAGSRPVLLLHNKLTPVDLIPMKRSFDLIVRELEFRGAAIEDEYIDEEKNDLATLEKRYGRMDCFRNKYVWCLNRGLVPAVQYLLLKNGIDCPLMALTSSILPGSPYPPVRFLMEPWYETGRTAVRMLMENLLESKPLKNIVLQTPCLGIPRDQ